MKKQHLIYLFFALPLMAMDSPTSHQRELICHELGRQARLDHQERLQSMFGSQAALILDLENASRKSDLNAESLFRSLAITGELLQTLPHQIEKYSILEKIQNRLLKRVSLSDAKEKVNKLLPYCQDPLVQALQEKKEERITARAQLVREEENAAAYEELKEHLSHEAAHLSAFIIKHRRDSHAEMEKDDCHFKKKLHKTYGHVLQLTKQAHKNWGDKVMQNFISASTPGWRSLAGAAFTYTLNPALISSFLVFTSFNVGCNFFSATFDRSNNFPELKFFIFDEKMRLALRFYNLQRNKYLALEEDTSIVLVENKVVKRKVTASPFKASFPYKLLEEYPIDRVFNNILTPFILAEDNFYYHTLNTEKEVKDLL